MSRYDNTWGQALIGKRLLEIRESEDLYLKCDDGVWKAEAEAD